MWPADDVLLDAWRRLCADGDEAEAFTDAVFQPLVDDLLRQFPRADPDFVTEAAITAIAAVFRKPTTYDPARGPLPGYLRMSARGDLRNLLDAEKRHRRRRIPWNPVAHDRAARNDDADSGLSAADQAEAQAATAEFSPEDRTVCELWLDGERATDVYAAALGLDGLPPAERTAAVKRAKDRVKARLKRMGGTR